MSDAGDRPRPPPGRTRLRDRSSRPRVVSALSLALLGAVVSFLLARIIQQRQDAHIQRSAAAVASAVARATEQISAPTFSAIRSWAARAGPPTLDGGPSWQIAAERFVTEHPAVSAIVLIDRGRVSQEIGPSEARERLRSMAPEALDLVARNLVRGRSREAVIGPVRLSDGRAALGVPVMLDGRSDEPDLILALFEATVALQQALDRGIPGYSFRILMGSQELFRSQELVPTQEVGTWQAVDAALTTSPPWTVTAYPTAMVVGGVEHYGLVVFVAGLIISGLLGVTTYMGQSLRFRDDRLVVADADLDESRAEIQRDETEILELRGALDVRVAERTAVLTDAVAELETFNYSVSHDLRSPMGAVINFAAILEHDYGDALDAAGREYLGRISGSAKAAVALMDGLLAFSRSGQEEIHRSRIDMRELAASVLEDFRSADAAAAGASIEIGDLPVAWADAGMIRRVFTNLLSNAVRFVTPGAKARVFVGGSLTEGEAVYYVRDEGVGFDMRYAEKLFRVFERLHPSEEFPGHGVGLAIVSRLVRRNGGRVWAQGAVSKGATFFFTLPTPGSASN